MNSDVQKLLSRYTPEVQRLVRAMRDQVRDLIPNAEEKAHLGWRNVAYSWDGTLKTMICAIGPLKDHVNLYFYKGRTLPDPAGILEGTGKSVRHVPIHATTDVRSLAIQRLIRQAASLAKDGADGKLKPL